MSGNLPAGAANDSNAPYNQEESTMTFDFMLVIDHDVEHHANADMEQLYCDVRKELQGEIKSFLEKHFGCVLVR